MYILIGALKNFLATPLIGRDTAAAAYNAVFMYRYGLVYVVIVHSCY